ncbi:MAG: beta-ketoacyl synthase N-terminal-like domain-containing protein [Oligoflexales bacterium]
MEVYVTGRSLATCAGLGVEDNWQRLFGYEAHFSEYEGNVVGKIARDVEREMAVCRKSSKYLHHQDDAAILAVLCSRIALEESQADPKTLGVIIGSSRGPWEKLESSVKSYCLDSKIFPHTSPVTTSNALSAAVARHFGCTGLALAVSATCASGLEAIGMGFLAVKSGFAQRMLVGGVDTAVSPFMVSMLKTARVYAHESGGPYLVKPSHPERTGLVLSQAGAILAIEAATSSCKPIAVIKGFGARTEQIGLTGVSADGAVLAEAIEDALTQANLSPSDVDMIIGHGSGTQKGDGAENAAIAKIFGDREVPTVFHKWLFGHSLGAAGAISAVLAPEHLANGVTSHHPYFDDSHPLRASRTLKRAKICLVTALGFGGNAAALVIGLPRQ